MEIKMNKKIEKVEINGTLYNFVQKKNVISVHQANKKVLLRLGVDNRDVEEIEFENYIECLEFAEIVQTENLIYLGVWDRKHPCEEEIFVNSNPHRLVELLDLDYSRDSENYPRVLNFHTYKSFEDAYDVALTMRERHQLCYN